MLLLLSLLACDAPEAPEPPPVVPGAPWAGAAEAWLRLPMGTPLGGYSARCSCLTGWSRQDARDSWYQSSFVESTGIHARPMVKAVWLDNGDADLVLLKADLIYAFDGLVAEVTDQLEATTGLPLDGRVVLTTNHSHASYGPFSDQLQFYLGGDVYHEEIFRRLADQLVEVALEAHDAREPAALGVGWARDWDPDRLVYRDRRGENDGLVPEGWEPDHGRDGVDPHLGVVRIDRAGGGPLAVLVHFGMHGIAMPDEAASMVSSDAPGQVEAAVQEAFREPVVVVHLQGAVGDASPGGRGDGLAKVESVGTYAVEPVVALWESTPTSDAPIRLQVASRHLWQHRDLARVTRDGAVDWRYAPLTEHYRGDDVVYDEEGRILSPIDEFHAPYGAAFCGSGDFDFPLGGIEADVPPYDSCLDVGFLMDLVVQFFDLEEEVPLPLPASYKAGTTVSRLGPLPTLDPDGSTAERELLAGFFPAELTAMYTEQWRRRAADELGYEMALAVAMSQDHEGYFLLPEDWLAGGYEPSINLWGPLQAEHVMEGMLHTADAVLGGDAHLPADTTGYYAPTAYPDRPLREIRPDPTPEAGERLDEAPEGLWTPPGIAPDLAVPAEVPRVQGAVQLAWRGGDPVVDSPRVVLERLEGEDWVEVRTGSGRPVTEGFVDILLGYTPEPLAPVDDDQEHRWWAGWQAVSHQGDRVDLPLGTYRLRASGSRWDGPASETSWPWTTAAYQVAGEPFEVVPAEVSLAVDGAGDLWAWIEADGWRWVDPEGHGRGANPVRGTLVVEWEDALGTDLVEVEAGEVRDGRSRVAVQLPGDAAWVRVTDPHGNTGTLDL